MMAKTAKKDNRGGARPNSGPKPRTLSAKQAQEFQSVADKLTEEFGYSMVEGVARMFYGEKATSRLKLQVASLFWKYSVIPAVEGGEADKSAVALFLPEQRPVELQVIHGDKDKE